MTGNELVKSHFRDHLSYGTEIRALLTYPNGKDKPSEKIKGILLFIWSSIALSTTKLPFYAENMWFSCLENQDKNEF